MMTDTLNDTGSSATITPKDLSGGQCLPLRLISSWWVHLIAGVHSAACILSGTRTLAHETVLSVSGLRHRSGT